MGRFLVRISVILVSIYFVVCYYVAQYYGEDIMDDWYSVLFETIIVVYAFSDGKYHCRYLKYTAITIPITDLLTRLNNHYNFLSITAHNLIPIGILAIGMGTTLTLAIRHFIHVMRLKNERRKYQST